MSVYTYAGAGSTVSFDEAAGTITFKHTHWRQPRRKRAVSPWTVPVGAVEGVSWREGTATKPAEMRLLLRGRVGHNKDGRADFNFISGPEKIGPLVEAINAAIQGAEPVLGFGSELTPARRPAPPQFPSTSPKTVHVCPPRQPSPGWSWKAKFCDTPERCTGWPAFTSP
ncbi:DUF4429 domain-containing protein [Rhodococcus sp. NPDC060084]|uniref:DUF4429 domain-containing protein n=1 Tax=Rhodococcus sp. NPDC060084 TaxID=3347053 RepID=UPI003665C9F0